MRPVDLFICPTCDTPFTPRAKTSRYCSPACANVARYQRAKARGLPPRRVWNKANTDPRRLILTRARHALKQYHLRNIKLKQGCKDCGYNAHHAPLEFDHIRGEKSFTIATRTSLINSLIESRKCDVVCANCHRIRTHERTELARLARLQEL